MPAKHTANYLYGRGKQGGAALLVILLLLIVGIAAILINSLSTSSIKNSRQANTDAALAQAKDALIGYAATYGDTHSGNVLGYLPCPDTDGNNGLQMEGSEETGGGSTCSPSNPANIDVSVVGRLPWKTLGLPVLRDSDGECLWYAVSGTYKDNPKTGLMNWDTDGQLQAYSADGTLLTPAGNQVVAVIFAPGAAQSGQDRTDPSTPPVAPVCGGNYTASNYLDNETVPVPGITVHGINNADIAIGKFIQPHDHRDINGNILLTMNDQMVFITKQDIWNAIQKRTDFQSTDPAINPLRKLTQQVATCLRHYAYQNSVCSTRCPNDTLPWAGTLSLSDYTDNTQYNDTSGIYAGRVPYLVGTSNGPPGNPLATLMNPTSCGAAWTATVDAWWNNWKDHLFYALAGDFKPASNGSHHCAFAACLVVRTPSSNYTAAGVVMFANSGLAGQTRASATTGASSTPRGTVSNYLEDISTGVGNASSFAGANGNENYYGRPASSTFNDVLCYLDPYLGVHCL
jgi:type II secretory pathway pseudopilin PulG